MKMIDSLEDVILVDESDTPIGMANKLTAHELGQLHRAFSVIVFNPQGEILLQQRTLQKYHSRGVWTNVCCSHPRKDEDILDAAHRRLVEEMGFDCPLKPITVLHYSTPPLDTGLIENEMLHLIGGITIQTEFTPNPDEAMAWRWITVEALKNEIKTNPEAFSYWFRIYMDRYDMKAMFTSLR
jgi:isopentenyl-diphosphate delta-isomerase